MNSTFQQKDAWQREKRHQYLVHFYNKYSLGGRYVFIQKSACSTLLQRELAVDTVMQSGDQSLCIEEKIVQWPGYTYARFCLETHSCTNHGYERDGWMKYAKADYLLYAFEMEDGGLDTYLIDFPALQAWFWSVYERYKVNETDEYNHTRSRLVPISDVMKAVRTRRYIIDGDGVVRKVPCPLPVGIT